MSHLDFCFNLAIYLKYCGIAKLCSYFFSLLNEILSSSILESNWRLLSPRLKWPDANWCEFWTSSDTNWHVCIISCHLSALGLESIWRLLQMAVTRCKLMRILDVFRYELTRLYHFVSFVIVCFWVREPTGEFKSADGNELMQIDANFWTTSDTNWHDCIISYHLSVVGLGSIWKLLQRSMTRCKLMRILDVFRYKLTRLYYFVSFVIIF